MNNPIQTNQVIYHFTQGPNDLPPPWQPVFVGWAVSKSIEIRFVNSYGEWDVENDDDYVKWWAEIVFPEWPYTRE